MLDLTEFEKGQIVGARIAGSSVIKTDELLGFSRASVQDHDGIQEARKNLQQLKKYRPNFQTYRQRPVEVI